MEVCRFIDDNPLNRFGLGYLFITQILLLLRCECGWVLVHRLAGIVRFRKPNDWVEVFSVAASNVVGGTGACLAGA